MFQPTWMQQPQSFLVKQDQQMPPDRPHLSWPSKLLTNYADRIDLERLLQCIPGQSCQVVKYLFDAQTHQWEYHKATTNLNELRHMVDATEQSQKNRPETSSFLMASSLQAEAIRCFGFYMKIAPSFFVLPPAHLRVITGTRGDIHLMFSLQYMSKYPIGHSQSESQRAVGLPRYRFSDGACPQNHEWHVNHARLIFYAGSNSERYPTSSDVSFTYDNVYRCWRGLYMFDQDDDSIATSMRNRLITLDRERPWPAEVYQGLGQIIQDVIFLVSLVRTEFLDEAMRHLQELSKQCLDETFDPNEHLTYLRHLYDLLPLWSQVRRQLEGTKNLVAQVSRHEFSSFISGERDDRYFVKRLSVVEDQLRRCNDAADKTKNLIDLIMNIASLQESRSANAFAASIQRITVLTFIYLPLTLAASILGMNVIQITGEGTHSQLWLYFVMAVALMTATFGGYYMSNINFKDYQRLQAAFRRTKETHEHGSLKAHRLKS